MIIFGPPGAGKGTQGPKIENELGERTCTRPPRVPRVPRVRVGTKPARAERPRLAALA